MNTPQIVVRKNMSPERLAEIRDWIHFTRNSNAHAYARIIMMELIVEIERLQTIKVAIKEES